MFAYDSISPLLFLPVTKIWLVTIPELPLENGPSVIALKAVPLFVRANRSDFQSCDAVCSGLKTNTLLVTNALRLAVSDRLNQALPLLLTAIEPT